MRLLVKTFSILIIVLCDYNQAVEQTRTSTPTGAPPFDNIDYDDTAIWTGPFPGGTVYCDNTYDDLGIRRDDIAHKLAFQEDSTCEEKEETARVLEDAHNYKGAHQAWRHYIETCALTTNVAHAFTPISGTNDLRSTDKNRYIDCREWLKKVLYLNSDTIYYCSDVLAILSTFQYFDSARGNDVNGTLAVVKYMLDNNRCPMFKKYFEDGWEATREYQLQNWRDTVKDSLTSPLDTTLPTLEELDLTILYGASEVVVDREDRIGKIVAVRNPFMDLLELRYRLDRSAMTRIEIYDVLGKSVYSEGQGYKEEGDHIVTLSSTDWPSGSYYVRLSTPSGEVKTVKVIKE